LLVVTCDAGGEAQAMLSGPLSQSISIA